MVAALILNILGSLMGLPGDFWMNDGAIFTLVLWIGIAIPSYLYFLADFDLYETLVNPYLKPSILSAQDALNTITRTLTTHEFSGKSWTLANSQYDPETEVYANDYVLKSDGANAILKTRLRAASFDSCLVTYWFELAKRPIWLPPFSKSIRRIDTALWKALK